MNKAFSARLRHHSCFSQTVAKETYTTLLAKSDRTDSVNNLSTRVNPPFLRHWKAHANVRVPVAIRFTNMSTSLNGSHGIPRTKRKSHPGLVEERPQKLHRALNGKESAGDNTPEVGPIVEEIIDMDELGDTRIISAAMADTAEWQAAIEKVVRNVVSIRFCQTCSFDTDQALTSEATGFVVDAERG